MTAPRKRTPWGGYVRFAPSATPRTAQAQPLPTRRDGDQTVRTFNTATEVADVEGPISIAGVNAPIEATSPALQKAARSAMGHRSITPSRDRAASSTIPTPGS